MKGKRTFCLTLISLISTVFYVLVSREIENNRDFR
ncbi:hypothetical protein SAMN05421676_104146 [Salinibacillus kushneri]|uniref:Uncharacterized protein n=1 Tax=Salinibacillus kushneri TaxID=237682 RepID=A0A1I0DTW5_9BACI|nr:hypothetical protein SAMN05421676_104146 [Salinibacillus kushneri]